MPSTKTDQIYLVKGAGRKHPPFFYARRQRVWPWCNMAKIMRTQKNAAMDGGVMIAADLPGPFAQ